MRLSSILSLFTLALFIGSCATEPPPKSDAVISINLANTGQEEIEIFNIEKEIHHQFNAETDSISLALTDEIILNLASGRSNNYIHVSPEAVLTLDTLSSKPLRLGVTGETSSENGYLKDFAQILSEQSAAYSMRDMAKFQADSFSLMLNEKYAALEELIAEINEDETVSQAYKSAMELRYLATRGTDIMDFKGWHNYLNEEYPEVPENFYSEIEEIDFSDPALMVFAVGREFGFSWSSNDIDYEDYDSDDEYFNATLVKSQADYPNSIMGDYCYYSAVSNQVNFGSGIDGATGLIEDFKAAISNVYLNNKLNETIEPWLDLKSGLAAPDFEAMTRDGKPVKLSDLKGKKVYVDVWATWCGPCIREIPALKELESELHEENIEFVSVSIDQEADKEKWLAFIAEEDMQGVQLMADGAWKSDVVTSYNIKGIPRFLLVDSEGKIITSNAPRPSDPSIKDMLLR